MRDRAFWETGRRKNGGKSGRRAGKGPTGESRHGARGRGAERDRGGAQREGRLRLTREGRPIVVPDSPEEPAIRVPGHALGDALPKDRVLVRLEKRRLGAPAHGRIVRVVERGIREFVGRYATVGDRRFVRFRP